MNGRRAIIGLLLLCALVFCAVGASGASAKGITGFECVKGGEGPKFKDADCDITNAGGEWGHKEFTVIFVDTKKISEKYKLNTTLLTLATEVNCTEQTTEGSVENKAGPPMKAEGTATITFNSCTVNKPAKCVVKQPIIAKTAVKTVFVNEAKEEYGLEYSPTGASFTELTFENKGAEKCGIANGGKAFPVKGSLIGTGSGPTMAGGIQRFKAAEASMQKLTVGGEPATLEGETTLTNVATGNAISFTIVP